MTVIVGQGNPTAPKVGPAPKIGAPKVAAPKAPAVGPAPSAAAPMTYQQMLNEARAEATLTTAGPLSQLAAQIAAQNRQTADATKAIAGDFQGLGNFVNQAAGQVGQVGSNLDSQLGNLQTTAQNSLEAYTPKGDPDVGNVGMPALVSTLAAQHGLADQQQAGYQDLMTGLKGAYAAAGQQDLANVNVAGRSAIGNLNAKYAGELGKQGALTESDLGKLRQQEITNNYNQGRLAYDNASLREKTNYQNAMVGIDQGALGVKQEGAATAAQNADTSAAKAAHEWSYQRAQLAIDRFKANTTATNNRETQAYRQGLLAIDRIKADTARSAAQALAAYRVAETKLKQGTGGAVPLTQNENNRMLNDLGTAVAAAHQLSQTQTPEQIVTDLTAGNAQLTLQGGKYKTVSALPRPVVQAALEYLHTGSISHQTYVTLHQMGVRGLPFKVAPPVK